MRNIGIAENTLMSVQLKLDAYEARATTAEAERSRLIDRIDERDAEIRSLRAQVEERSAWAAAQVKDALEVGRAQVEQERAGIVAMVRNWEFGIDDAGFQIARIADAIERHEDKETRA
jgi:chromosome segregation ATPase